jgi:hypothetical protein
MNMFFGFHFFKGGTAPSYIRYNGPESGLDCSAHDISKSSTNFSSSSFFLFLGEVVAEKSLDLLPVHFNGEYCADKTYQGT